MESLKDVSEEYPGDSVEDALNRNDAYALNRMIAWFNAELEDGVFQEERANGLDLERPAARALQALLSTAEWLGLDMDLMEANELVDWDAVRYHVKPPDDAEGKEQG